MAQNADESRREVLGLFSDPLGDVFGSEPCVRFYFFGMQNEWPFVLAAIYPHKFLAGFLASVNPQDATRNAVESNAEFFVHFAECAGVVILSSVKVP